MTMMVMYQHPHLVLIGRINIWIVWSLDSSPRARSNLLPSCLESLHGEAGVTVEPDSETVGAADHLFRLAAAALLHHLPLVAVQN